MVKWQNKVIMENKGLVLKKEKADYDTKLGQQKLKFTSNIIQ